MLDSMRVGSGRLRIVCPFIKERSLDRLLELRPKRVQVITRFNLADFAERVSDIAALRELLDCGAAVRGIRNLHAKVYVFGSRRAIVTSANLTEAGLSLNPEFGVVTSDPTAIMECGDYGIRRYFDSLWRRGGKDLILDQVLDWDRDVTRHLALGHGLEITSELPDYGADVGIEAPLEAGKSNVFGEAPQAFVKFLGDSSNRPPLSLATLEELRESECHRVVGYPVKRRPQIVEDGAEMFIARFVHGDTRVFGRAIALKHEPGRDDATRRDVRRRSWRKKWPHYIRVHHAEFVAGTMENGVSLGELMEDLKADSFAPTQRNAKLGDGSNTNPRLSIRRQAAARLTDESYRWLGERLQNAFEVHGKILDSELKKLNQPELPPDWRPGQRI